MDAVLLSRIQIHDNLFAGGLFDWLISFSIMTGIALVTGYVLPGSTNVIIKSTSPFQVCAYRQAFPAASGVSLFIATVLIWTPYHNPEIIDAWLSSSRVNIVWIFPFLGLVSFVFCLRTQIRCEIQPFIWSLMLLLSTYLSLQSGIFPYAGLSGVSVYETASQSETLSFTLWGRHRFCR